MKPIATSCLLAASLLASCAATDRSTPPPAADEPLDEATPVPAADTRTADIQTLEFEVEIAAPVEKVWEIMFSAEGYTEWTAPFMTGSTFEGSWDEGERIRFLAPGGSGMVAEIAVNRPYELVSVKHLGYVFNGVEDTTSDDVTSWAPAYENYHFRSTGDGTVVRVEQEVLAGSEGTMQQTWPRALAALKSLCEAE